eukprot:TRINITY_DN6602_c0_g1_i1.p1 TRINITY_DN6602_c0_g1~~TRINITY_DN6602_c0_g1_i1.p1  ORF type:complete len:331 (+),score=52.68 TRINITY_DN6602_c0_g1_i1:58-1050(+)
MAHQLKQVRFGEIRTRKFKIPKKKKYQNSLVMGEHSEFWQRHESAERHELKHLSKNKHALLALGRAIELRALVEAYMREPSSELPAFMREAHGESELRSEQPKTNAVKARRPPPPPRRRSGSAGSSTDKRVPASEARRPQDGSDVSILPIMQTEVAGLSAEALPDSEDYGEDGDVSPDSEEEREVEEQIGMVCVSSTLPSCNLLPPLSTSNFKGRHPRASSASDSAVQTFHVLDTISDVRDIYALEGEHATFSLGANHSDGGVLTQQRDVMRRLVYTVADPLQATSELTAIVEHSLSPHPPSKDAGGPHLSFPRSHHFVRQQPSVNPAQQ